jgi:uncharacterized membrane protein YhiD involved in acid resistance
VLLTLENIFEFFRQLPVGLIAAAAFLFLAFFVMMLWLEVAALARALKERQNDQAAVKRMCDDLDRLEEQTARLNERLNSLSSRETQSENNGND